MVHGKNEFASAERKDKNEFLVILAYRGGS